MILCTLDITRPRNREPQLLEEILNISVYFVSQGENIELCVMITRKGNYTDIEGTVGDVCAMIIPYRSDRR